MTKREIYNGLVGLYQKTGQGAPKYIFGSNMNKINELINEGLVKIVTIPYNHLPDDVMVCLTNVYCTEEYPKTMALQYMRLYLDCPVEHHIFKTEKDDNYDKWVNENKLLLEKIPNTPLYVDNDVISVTNDIESYNDIITFIKDKKHYIENKTIVECVEINNIRTTELNELIKLTNEILSLYNMKKDKSENDDIKITENKIELEKYKTELNKRKDAINFLSTFNRDKHIRDCF